jgi:hypothetical protein
MARAPNPRNYASSDMSSAIVDAATPPAEALLLASADAWVVQAAITPYCGCGRIFDSTTKAASNTEFDRYFAVVVAPGAVYGRMALSRAAIKNSVWPGGWTFAHEAWTNDGGSTGFDVIELPTPLGSVHYRDLSFAGEQRDIIETGTTEDNAPTDNINRLFELQTQGYPTVEPCFVSKVAGVSLAVSHLVEDLETL